MTCNSCSSAVKYSAELDDACTTGADAYDEYSGVWSSSQIAGAGAEYAEECGLMFRVGT